MVRCVNMGVCADTETPYVLKLQICTGMTDGKREVSCFGPSGTIFWFLEGCYC